MAVHETRIRFFLTAALLWSWIPAQVQVGLGSYANTGSFSLPPGTPYVTPDFKQPVETATWWSTLITTQYSLPIFPHPFSVEAAVGGLQLGYPGAPTTDGVNVSVPHRADLVVGVQGLNAPDARVASYSDWSVTARWQDGARLMEATFGHGFPFVYFKISGGNADIALGSGATLLLQQGAVAVVSVGGRVYGIFAPTGSAWSGADTLTSALAGKDYLSVALLPDTTAATLAFYRQYAYSFIVSTQVTWQYQEATAKMFSTFTAVTTPKEGSETGTLFALFRHQWLSTVTPLTAYTYASARGTMKVAAGNSFTTAMTFNGVLPALPNLGSDPATLNTQLNAVSPNAGEGNDYGVGVAMGQIAEAASIAEVAGQTTKYADLINGLKTTLQNWFTAGGAEQFYYSPLWNSLIAYPPSYNSDTRLSDHHFHYGYFLMAAAAVAQADSVWARESNWGGMVEMLIRDLNSWQPADSLFGRFRYFDPYEGHGWADGMGFARGNNEESSSESMNANAGIILWGAQTGNKVIRDLGIFMYVNETRAIEQYWWDVDQQVFPAAFAPGAVGMIWSDGGAYATWFSGTAQDIRGINLLPSTAAHLYLGRRPDYIVKNFNAGYQQGGSDWSSIFDEYLAYANPDQALANYGSGIPVQGGDTPAHTLYQLESLAAVGRLDTAVTADIPSYAVFDKNSTRAYTAYNPNATALKVTFNDGYSMNVPAKTQLTQTGPILPVLSIVSPSLSGSRGHLEFFNGVTAQYGFGKVGNGSTFDAMGRRFMIPSLPLSAEKHP